MPTEGNQENVVAQASRLSMATSTRAETLKILTH